MKRHGLKLKTTQPRKVSGPFTPGQLLDLDGIMRRVGKRLTLHRPWTRGKTYQPNGLRECARRVRQGLA